MTTKTTTPLIVKVKKEPATDEIKDFAETAMNELLGWYGYENVDRNDLMRCAASRANNNNNNNLTTGATTRSNGCGNLQQLQQQQQRLAMTTTSTSGSSSNPATILTTSALVSPLSTAQMLSHSRLAPTNCSTISSSPSPTIAATSSHSNGPTTHNPPSSRNRNRLTTATKIRSSSTPDRSTLTSSPELNTNTNSSSRQSQSPGLRVSDEKNDVECGWCKRAVSLGSPEFLATPEGPRYCSESCFSQSRRASFKRAKTCDWCKHVRHAVSYVDFQDGASQLQFCSDKCLNQYKMQIFCRETQAHLDQHPHLKETGKTGNDGSLITPDLWLRNCKSRSVSPASDRSPSRSPTLAICRTQPAPSTGAIDAPHRPVITLAPSSKLLSRPNLLPAAAVTPPPPLLPSRVSPRVARKRRSTRHAQSSSSASSSLRTDQSPPQQSAGGGGLLNGTLAAAAAATATAPLVISTTTATTGAAPPTLQDLTTNAQHRNIAGHLLPPMLGTPPAAANHPNQPPSGPPHNYRHPHHHHHQQFRTPPANLYPMRGPSQSTAAGTAPSLPPHPPAQMMEFMHRALSGQQQPNSFATHPQHNPFPGYPHQQHQQLHPPPVQHAPSNAEPPRFFGSTSVPPITIMVPYPVLVPIPIPVPIPMPIVAFLRAAQLQLDAKNNNNNSRTAVPADSVPSPDKRATTTVDPAPLAGTSATAAGDEQPLDCTKSRELCAEDDPEQLIEVVCEDDDGDEVEDDGLLQLDTDKRGRNEPDEALPAASDVGGKNVTVMATNRPIPKLKITRLNSRRGFITPNEPMTNRDEPSSQPEAADASLLAPAEPVVGNDNEPPSSPVTAAAAAAAASGSGSETGRPLRKRKRLVDCDYSRFRDDDKRRPLAAQSTSGGNGAPK